MKSWLKRWTIVCVTILFCLSTHWLRPVGAASLPLPKELNNFFNTPLNQLPKTLCTNQLKTQLAQQQISLNCQTGVSISADKFIPIGSLSSLGINQTSLQELSKINGIDLNKIGADQLQKFYSLVSPATLLGQQFNNFYQNQPLANLPLLQSALTQNLLQQVNLGNLQPLQSLNSLIQNAGGVGNLVPSDLLNPQKIVQQVANIALSKVVAAIPSFGNFSLGNIPIQNLQSFSVANALPALIKQPLSVIPGVNQLVANDLKAVGLNKIAMSQLPRPLSYAAGIQLGKFDLPLGNSRKDERDSGRQVSGGITGSGFRKENCNTKCNFVEISAPGTPYHGAIWADGEHYVPDGFGPACAIVPGLCRGPAGNHPFGEEFRVFLTNINSRAGTAQRRISLRICDDFRINCSPYIIPPGGFPAGTVREGDLLPFNVPNNYGS
jgi:hypothetical protein